MGFEATDKELEDASLLEPTGCRSGEHSLDVTASAVTVGAEGSLAPQHGGAKHSLGVVVRGFEIVVLRGASRTASPASAWASARDAETSASRLLTAASEIGIPSRSSTNSWVARRLALTTPLSGVMTATSRGPKADLNSRGIPARVIFPQSAQLRA